MPGPASLFREIHRLRRFLDDLKEQLERIPRSRKAFQTRLAKAEQTLKDEQDAVKKLKVTASDKEKQLKSKEALIERYTRQQNEVSSKKEYDALVLEIAHARDAIALLETEILQAMSDGDDKQARLPELEKAVAAAKQDLAKFEADVGPRKALLEQEQTRAQASLKEVEAQVPRDLRPQYDRTISSLGADGFALARGMACTECNTEINRTIELRLINDEFAVCPSCGRILYLEASPSA
jgi:predicted  nucleic acid-binding Zn-ribbon protein